MKHTNYCTQLCENHDDAKFTSHHMHGHMTLKKSIRFRHYGSTKKSTDTSEYCEEPAAKHQQISAVTATSKTQTMHSALVVLRISLHCVCTAGCQAGSG